MSVLDIGDPNRPVDLIWCHATGLNAEAYLPALLPLGTQLRILALDMRGHGQTTLPADPARLKSWRVFAEDVVAFLDMAGVNHPVTLAGHSMGGATAIIVADQIGTRAKNLLLLDPVLLPRRVYWMNNIPGLRSLAFRKSPMVENALRRRATFDSRDAAFETYRSRSAFRTWPEDALRAYIEGGFDDREDGVALSCAPAWEAATFRGAMSVNLWPMLARLKAPLHILRAERGSTCALTTGQRVGRTVETIAGSTHFLPIERPELLRGAALEACAIKSVMTEG